MRESVYFTSDHHFGTGPDHEERVRRFVRWIDGLSDAATLYLLGDVFDFWLDYPRYMPKLHMEVLYALSRLRDTCCELVFVGGNHDVWCADFFRDTLGVATMESGTTVEHQGRRIHLDHGDGLLSGDRFYSLYRTVVRHPVPVFLAKAIHPELLHSFADWLSRNSRKRYRGSDAELEARIRNWAAKQGSPEWEHLVIGHIHLPVQIEFDGWTFTCLGDWVRHFTAARLRDGNLELVRVDAEGKAGTL